MISAKNLSAVPTPQLLHGLTIISDHPKAGEFTMYCGLQSGTVPVRISINFWSHPQNRAGGPTPTDLCQAPFWANSL